MKKALLWGAALCVALIFAGCPADDNDDNKDNGDNTSGGFTGFKLTVTGAPSEKYFGASLLNPQDRDISIAIGIAGTGGVFDFYHPAPPGSVFPVDTNRPFNEVGYYLVALAEVDIQTFAHSTVYIYTGNPAGPQPAPVSFPVTAPLSWGNFTEQSLLQQP